MKFGLSESTITVILNVFSNYPQIQSVLIYGSRSLGTFHNGSDIDLCLKGQNLTTDLILEINGQLENLNLPYQIDLCAYSLLTNPDFINHIDRIGQPFNNQI